MDNLLQEYSVHKRGSFTFFIKTSQFEALASILSSILDGLYNDDEPMLQFHKKATAYYEAAFNGTTTAACWGLLNIANRYLEGEEDDNINKDEN